MVQLLGILLFPAVAQAPDYRIDLSVRPFRVEGPRFCVLAEPTGKPPQEPREMVFREGDRFCVWRRDGLHTREKNRVRHWRLQVEDGEAPWRPDRGTRIALSGARRIGDTVYLLVRKELRASPPRETLYEVSLAGGLPQPKALTSFEGLSLGQSDMDDRLGIVGNKPSWIARRPDGSWGAVVWEAGLSMFVFQPFGTDLVDAWRVSDRIHLFSERTPYGTYLLGRADLLLGKRRELLETRGPLFPVPSTTNLFLEGESTLRSLATGAVAVLPAKPSVLETPHGWLAYWPEERPERAMLLDPETLSVRAEWRRG